MSHDAPRGLVALAKDILASDPARSHGEYYIDISPCARGGARSLVGNGAGARSLQDIARRLFDLLDILAPDRMQAQDMRYAAEIDLAGISSHFRLAARERLRADLAAIGQDGRIPDFLLD